MRREKDCPQYRVSGSLLIREGLDPKNLLSSYRKREYTWPLTRATTQADWHSQNTVLPLPYRFSFAHELFHSYCLSISCCAFSYLLNNFPIPHSHTSDLNLFVEVRFHTKATQFHSGHHLV